MSRPFIDVLASADAYLLMGIDAKLELNAGELLEAVEALKGRVASFKGEATGADQAARVYTVDALTKASMLLELLEAQALAIEAKRDYNEMILGGQHG